MIQVGMHEAKSQLSELVKQLHAGQEIQFTNRGKVVAELCLPREERREQAKAFLDKFRAVRAGMQKVKLEELCSWKNEGRM